MRKSYLFNFVLSFLLTSFTIAVQATTVMGIISPRHSTDVLSGAHAFLLKHPQHKIVLRTTDQFGSLNDKERHQLLEKSDLIFTGCVFGNIVPWLKKYADENAKSVRLIAVHGDRNLVKASHIKGEPLLASANLDQLMLDPPLDPNLDLQAWFNAHLETHKAHHDWLLAKTFWADRNSENIEGLFHHLFHLSGEPLKVPTPALNASLRIFVNSELTKAKKLT